MNQSEKKALQYLSTISLDIIHEPDGKVPPDFLVGHQLAVEVRTLNENLFSTGHPHGLEQDEMALRGALGDALREFDEPREVESYWVCVEFSRPLPRRRRIQKIVHARLREFLIAPCQTPHRIELSPEVAITLLKSRAQKTQRFRLGIQEDLDSSGMVVETYVRNTRYCVDEKTRKIEKYSQKYHRWWLLLVDYLAGLSANDSEDQMEIQRVRYGITKPPSWERIVVIKPESCQEILSIN